MRILISIDYFQPQLGYSESHLAKEFKKAGHTVLVFTSNYYFPFPNYAETVKSLLADRKLKPGKSTWQGVKVVRQKMFFELFCRAIYFGHRGILNDFKPDIIIANKVAGLNTFIFSFLKGSHNCKLVCYDSHLPSEISSGNRISKSFFYWVFRILASSFLNAHVDKFIAVQEDTSKVMKKYYGIKKKVFNIPLGTDIDKFYFDIKQRSKLRAKLKIGISEFVIIYTGKIIESKGVDVLFESFGVLNKKYNNMKLLLVGNAPKNYLEYCFTKIDKNIFSKVILTGFVKNDDLYKYYSASDVAVWPLQESTSMNDAASCGLVFIANDKVGARLRLSNNNALLYKKGNYTDLANKIEYLYENPAIRKKMGKNGRELVEKKLSWEKISKEYLKV